MKQLCVPLAHGFEEIEAISIIDICRRGDIDVIVAGVDSKTAIGAHNIPVVTDCLIGEINIDKLDMVVLPGGWDGTQLLASNKTMQSILKQMKQQDKYIGAICAAPYALDCADVLGDQFTCYPSIEKKIKSPGYNKNANTVINGKIITSQGVGTAICFALEIVKTLQGDKHYLQLKQQLLAKC